MSKLKKKKSITNLWPASKKYPLLHVPASNCKPIKYNAKLIVNKITFGI